MVHLRVLRRVSNATGSFEDLILAVRGICVVKQLFSQHPNPDLSKDPSVALGIFSCEPVVHLYLECSTKSLSCSWFDSLPTAPTWAEDLFGRNFLRSTPTYYRKPEPNRRQQLHFHRKLLRQTRCWNRRNIGSIRPDRNRCRKR